MATQFGYSVCVSDIRATWKDGRILDCLKKTYKITDCLGVAFAGSVQIGFALVEELRAHCLRGAYLDSPDALMTSWPRFARRVFAKSPDLERQERAELLLFGLSHRNHRGRIPRVFKLRSPTFEPEVATGTEILSIGSGSAVEPYVSVLRNLSNQSNPLARWEAHDFVGRGVGIGLMSVMFDQLRELSSTSISYQLQCSVLSPHEFSETPNNGSFTTVHSDGTQTVWELRMPALATSYDEFESIVRSAGSTTAGAVC
jgi:hypothetical protein